ncbi:hypothetical protein T459_22894 [Capsicum annuum]|uniref:Uncharacterized protein n=1 Tax=Capsicum annuum TaxID=4072 RepID=A0A2G2YQU4_CAPAN|nr:hypothetical protein T459_22894 [Capsicum annuum]
MRESINVSGRVSAPLSKSKKDVPVGARSKNKEQRQIRDSKGKQMADIEQKSKEVDDSTCINMKEFLIKTDLDSFESKIKTYIDVKLNDLERVMNDRFSEALKSLQSKNETVEKNLDVIMYYLSKKYRNKNFPTKRYTTIDCFFKVYIDKAYVNYYNADVGKELATQDASTRTDEVADMVFAVIALKDRCIHKYDSMASSRKRAQTTIYAEYLSEGLGTSSSGIDAQYHRLRYASLLWKYRSEKSENDYFSENDNLPRPRSKFTSKETDRVLHIQ